MSLNALIDPNVFLLDGPAVGPDLAEQFLLDLKDIAAAFDARSWLNVFSVSDLVTYLFENDLYPGKDDIKQFLVANNLAHIYSEKDISAIYGRIFKYLNDMSEVTKIKSTVLSEEMDGETSDYILASADIVSEFYAQVSYYLNSSECCEGEFFVISACGKEKSAQQFHGTIDLLELVDGDLLADCEIAGLVTAYGSLCDYLNNVDPYILWKCALTNLDLGVCLTIGAAQNAGFRFERFLETELPNFLIGEHFYTSLGQNEANLHNKHASATYSACVSAIHAPETLNFIDFYRQKAGGRDKENVIRIADDARAKRCHITQRHEALRLLVWLHTDGSIEFANVGPKNEMKIQDGGIDFCLSEFCS